MESLDQRRSAAIFHVTGLPVKSLGLILQLTEVPWQDKANQTTTYQYAHGRSNKALCKFTQKPDGCKETAELSRP